MHGTLLGQPDDKNVRPAIDPCSVYVDRGLKCPPYIAIGELGKVDIVPLAALLKAAGGSLVV